MCDRSIALILATAFCLTAPDGLRAQGSAVEMEVFETASPSDDYLCWSPVPVRARLVSADSPTQEVTVASTSAAGGGAVEFHSAIAKPAPDSKGFGASLKVQLLANGGWTKFWVVGTRASIHPQDVSIRMESNNGDALGTWPVMVRVRKDAGTLTSQERDRFLSALRTLHDVDNGTDGSHFTKYSLIHLSAFDQGIHHGGDPTYNPLFLAWHRAFLLNLERELQAIDPAVSLPYWRFDLPDGSPAPRSAVFTPDFLGRVNTSSSAPGGFIVDFSATNPLRNWTVPNLGALTRVDNGVQAPIRPGALKAIFDATESNGAPRNNAYRTANGAMELGYHNAAHARLGGWLGRGHSPADPLFFLLHANVDRGWVLWQARFSRNDAALAEAYSLQGTYPGNPPSNKHRKGSFSRDVMWPWSPGGDQGTADDMDDWPGNIQLTMPAGAVVDSSRPPTPASMVDSMGFNETSNSHHVCYDDVRYRTLTPEGG